MNPLDKIQTTNSTTVSLTKSQTKYTAIDIKAGTFYYFEANPNQMICDQNDKEPIRRIFDLMALSAKKNGLDKNQKLLNWITMNEHKITIDEAFRSFWKAMADPYVPSGSGIEVRHLMKYVTEMRESPDNKLYSYEYVKKQVHEGVPMEAFEITETEGTNGKKLWRRAV